MKNKTACSIAPPRQKGMTLVEIMIALVLGLMLMGGIGKIYLSSKQSYRLQEALSRIQENGRFALNYLAQEVRPIGYQGCPNLESIEPVVLAAFRASPAPAVPSFDLDASLLGVDGATDNLTTMRGGSCSSFVSGVVDNVNSTIIVGDLCDMDDDDIAMITDCKTAHIFRIDKVDTGTDEIDFAGGANTATSLGKDYDDKAEVIQFISKNFYISNNPAGVPSLYQKVDLEPAEELVEGVEDMQITYGVEIPSALGSKLTYQGATWVSTNTDGIGWKDVKSVRIGLLLRSLVNNVTPAPVPVQFNGATVTPTDRRMRKVFTSTIFIRNRT